MTKSRRYRVDFVYCISMECIQKQKQKKTEKQKTQKTKTETLSWPRVHHFKWPTLIIIVCNATVFATLWHHFLKSRVEI